MDCCGAEYEKHPSHKMLWETPSSESDLEFNVGATTLAFPNAQSQAETPKRWREAVANLDSQERDAPGEIATALFG